MYVAEARIEGNREENGRTFLVYHHKLHFRNKLIVLCYIRIDDVLDD